MPRMQIYLPEDLYAEVKSRNLRVSELLQQAVRTEIRRQELADAADEYLEELIAEVGEPTPEELAWAEEFVARIKAHRTKSEEPEHQPDAQAPTSGHAPKRAS
jgi:post-segregation antitoxin (ccd killing protein)